MFASWVFLLLHLLVQVMRRSRNAELFLLLDRTCLSLHFFSHSYDQSRRHGGGASVGLATPNKAPSPPRLKHETLWSFCKFLNVKPPRTNAKPPY